MGSWARQVGHYNFTLIQLFKHSSWNMCWQGVLYTVISSTRVLLSYGLLSSLG